MSEQLKEAEAFPDRLKSYIMEHAEGGEDEWGDNEYTGRWLINEANGIIPANCVEFKLEERHPDAGSIEEDDFDYVRTEMSISLGLLEDLGDGPTVVPLYETSFNTDNLIDSNDGYFEDFGDGQRVHSVTHSTMEKLLGKLQAAEAAGEMTRAPESAAVA